MSMATSSVHIFSNGTEEDSGGSAPHRNFPSDSLKEIQMRYSEILAVLVLAALATAMPARSHAASVDIDVNVGPPAVVQETIPSPREGYTWAQGYWDYDGGHHVWRKGHWERNRSGEH